MTGVDEEFFRDTTTGWLERKLCQTRSGSVAAAVAIVCALLLHRTGVLERPELTLYDAFLRSRAVPARKIDPRMVIVAIRDGSLKAEDKVAGHITTAVLQKAIERIVAAGALVVGVDIFRDESMSRYEDEDLKKFRRYLGEHKNVIVAEFLGYHLGNERVRPVPPLKGIDEEQVGFVDYPLDPDGKTRRGLMYLDTPGRDDQPLSLSHRVAAAYLRSTTKADEPVNVDAKTSNLTLGPQNRVLPRFRATDGGYFDADARGYQYLIDFKEQKCAFPTVDFSHIDADADVFKGKVAFIGYFHYEDLHRTPLNGAEGCEFGADMAGVELHAHAASQLIRIALDNEQPMRSFDDGWEYVWIIIPAIAASFLGTLIRSRTTFTLTLLGSLALVIGTDWLLFVNWSYWMPSIPTLLGVLTASIVAGIRANRWLKIFISYASEDRERVHEVYICLRRAGHHPWVDRAGLLGGAVYSDQLGQEIRESDRFLACVSHYSVGKLQNTGGVLSREVSQGLENWRKRLDSVRYLIPVRLEPCDLPQAFELLHSVDFYKKNGARLLLRTLR